MELVLEIKSLLYEKRFTIEGARRHLDSRVKPDPRRAVKAEPAQQDLFPQSPILREVKRELAEILEILR